MHRRGGEEEKERCENCGKMIRRDEQPYHYCHKEGFALTKIVDESVGIKEMELGDKLKTTGEKTLNLVKTTGNLVVEKGKEAYVTYNF